MHISTNGVLSPTEVFKFSGDMLTSYFLDREKEEVKEELEKESYTPIEIMGLSPRTLNALINGNILSIEQLTKCTETKLSSIKGSSLTEKIFNIENLCKETF